MHSNSVVLLLLLLGALCFATSSVDGAEVILNIPFNSDKDFSGAYGRNPEWSNIVSLPEGGSAAEFDVPEKQDIKPVSKLSLHIPGEKIRGRKVTFTGEVRVVEATETAKWGGGEFSMWFPFTEGHAGYGFDHCFIGTRTDGWKTLRKEIDVPEYASHLLLNIGLNNARGKVQFRNVRVEVGDALISFPRDANMDLQDEVAGDHKGGWHDGGSEYDARRFPLHNRLFGNVPFAVIDPQKNKGKSVVVFSCPRLPEGPTTARAELNCTGKYLYLLHASAWSQPANTPVGSITLENTAGKTWTADVIFERDAKEWYMAKPGENAWVGAQFASGGSLGAAYVSRFEIPEGFGVVRRLTLQHAPDATAMWLVLAANISDTLYQKPENRNLVMKADEVWKPLPQTIIPAPKKGTALDFSSLFSNEPAGAHGRVIVTPTGHFAFADAPQTPVRFMAVGTGRDFGKYFGVPSECGSKEQITAYVEQMRRNGYNMIRWWPQARTEKQKAFENDPVKEDLQDWLYAELKRNGIYIVLSVDDWSCAYDNCNVWTDPRKKDHSIYLQLENRKNWLRWVTMQLTRVNPYTKKSLLEDPVLAGIDCNNELEFFFMRADDRYAPLWRDYLERKYKTVERLKAAWTTEAEGIAQFSDVKTFRPLGSESRGTMQTDKAEFITEQERGLLDWQKAELKKLGFQGFVTNFCMGRSMRAVGVRRSADFVMQNGYHAHPWGTRGPLEGGSIPQESSIGSAANIIRTFLASRMYDKPYDVSEHGHVFWNKYRYEQGLLMGAYSALNNFDALTAFFMQVTTLPNYPLSPFEIRHDPISRASELLTALLFRREDAKTSELTFRVKLNPEQAVQNGEVTESINATQMKLGLIGQTYVDLTDLPQQQGEVLFARTGGSKTAVRAADTNIVDMPGSGFLFDPVIAMLKEKKSLPATNVSSDKNGIYESSTGEILMDCNRNYLQVNTPRTQGIAGQSGTTVQLPALEILGMNRDCSISLSSIDGNKPIAEADRLLLFVITNVLNTGMSFVNSDQVERIKNGTTPQLLESGNYNLRIKTPKAQSLRMYALELDGTRSKEIPMVRHNGTLDVTLQTAEYPALYFELSAQ